MSGIRTQDDHYWTKSCLQALGFFLGRDGLSLRSVLDSLSVDATDDDAQNVSLALVRLFTTIFSCGSGDLGATISQVLTAVLDRIDQDTPSLKRANAPIWLQPLEQSLKDGDLQIDDLRNHILPVLFKRSPADYALFLTQYGLHATTNGRQPNGINIASQDSVNEQLLLAGLITGKELGLLSESEDLAMSLTGTSVLLPLRYVERLLLRSDRNARLAGLSLLITSRSATKAIPSSTFKIFKRRFPLFFADTDANFRGEVSSLIQRLMDRIRAASAVLHRHSKTDKVALAALCEHEDFLKWFVRFLRWELRPTASYQRHISALKALLIVVKSGVDNLVANEFLSKSALNETRWPFSVSILDDSLRKQLLDLLMDPFDDVRQTSASTLSIYAASCCGHERQSACQELRVVIEQAESTMLATGRADHADGVAHLYQLMFRLTDTGPPPSGPNQSPRQAVVAHLVDRLDAMLDTAIESLAVAANRYPIHGLLTSIRYTLMQEQSAYQFAAVPDHLVKYLHRIWAIVKPVLCNDAPEGYVPQDVEDVQEVTTKDTLSYCWRALKESSLLLGVLVNSRILNEGQILALGNLCFAQLAELRHRGAFSTVAQTWIVCCTRCKDMKVDGVLSLERWYRTILDSMTNKTTINTRRSAGLPSLICGLLIADKTRQSTSQAIRDMTELARQPIDSGMTQESSLPQVHALNCIKDVLKNTRLAEHSEQHIAHAFHLAAESLRSPAWAVRNCGLMLFRAAIDRLLGTSESHLEDRARVRIKISLSGQPGILDAIFDLLRARENEATACISNNEGVFPALQLLERVQIPDTKHQEAARAVEHLTFSCSWHVRDKAAHTFAAIVGEDEIIRELQHLLLTKRPDLNGQHGALLCAKYLVAKLDRTTILGSGQFSTRIPTKRECATTSPGEKLQEILSMTKHVYLSNVCPLIKAAFVDVMLVYDRFRRKKQAFNQKQARLTEWVSVLNFSEEFNNAIINPYPGPGEGYYRRTLAQTFAYQLRLRPNLDHSDAVSMILKLAQIDADAFSAFFEQFGRPILSKVYEPGAAVCMLVAACPSILAEDYNVGLKCDVQRFLLSLDLSELLVYENSTLLQSFLFACESATSPHNIESNYTYADQWLQLEAMRCECLAAGDLNPAQKGSKDIMNLVSYCRLAVQDEQASLFSREAAALALQQAKTLWHYMSETQPGAFLHSCIIVYDLLNDDDEDNRQLAAKVASRIVNTQTGSNDGTIAYEPISAQQRLIKFMLWRWASEPALADEAIKRAFDVRKIGPISSVQGRLAACNATDTALFVEEKQNLYIDEAREVKLWARVTVSLSPATIDRKSLVHLTTWVLGGLEELVLAFESTNKDSLGWTSKPDAFIIGLRVIYGAEVLMRLVTKGTRIPVRPSSLRKKLGMLALVADSGGVNGLWMAEIKRMMAESVISRLSLQRRLLDKVACKLGNS